MSTLVLASRNPKKSAELAAMLAPLGLNVLSVSQFSEVEPEETASTFIENALIKARHATEVSGLPAIADDSGLEVDALAGMPGVHSARYGGVPSNDARNNQTLLAALADVPASQRGARYVCALVYLRHPKDPVPLIALGTWHGQILLQAQGSGGFGYDPLFWLPQLQCSAAQLPAAQKNQISHRGLALAELIRQLTVPTLR